MLYPSHLNQKSITFIGDLNCKLGMFFMDCPMAELVIILYCLLKWDCMITPDVYDQQNYAVLKKLIEKWEAES